VDSTFTNDEKENKARSMIQHPKARGFGNFAPNRQKSSSAKLDNDPQDNRLHCTTQEPKTHYRSRCRWRLELHGKPERFFADC
jgi:hypothetical protein